jgi:hypothetical protein
MTVVVLLQPVDNMKSCDADVLLVNDGGNERKWGVRAVAQHKPAFSNFALFISIA